MFQVGSSNHFLSKPFLEQTISWIESFLKSNHFFSNLFLWTNHAFSNHACLNRFIFKPFNAQTNVQTWKYLTEIRMNSMAVQNNDLINAQLLSQNTKLDVKKRPLPLLSCGIWSILCELVLYKMWFCAFGIFISSLICCCCLCSLSSLLFYLYN